MNRIGQAGRVVISDAYRRPVWGSEMGPFEALRDAVKDGSLVFERLDAVQLVKHAFGLVTEADRKNKKAGLLYLYAEPRNWPNGKPVDDLAKETHRTEIEAFSDRVSGAAVAFAGTSCQALLASWRADGTSSLARHADEIDKAFAP